MINIFQFPSPLIALMASTSVLCQPSCTVQKSDFYIGKLTLSMRKKDVRAILGKPSKIEIDNSCIIDNIIHYYYHYPNFVFNFGEDELYEIECRSRELATPKGVRVGDNISLIKKLYGPGKVVEAGNEVYIRYNLDGTDCYLTFHAKNDYIYLISLRFDYA